MLLTQSGAQARWVVNRCSLVDCRPRGWPRVTASEIWHRQPCPFRLIFTGRSLVENAVLQILLCHSVLGLREVEREAADLLASWGQTVAVPDLFNGATAASIDEGAEIVAHVGWATVCRRAAEALTDLPVDTVLAGFSMGVGVASELWASHPLSAAALLLHALPTIPKNVRPAFPFQVHVGGSDGVFADELSRQELQDRARTLGLMAEVFCYHGAGHFFTDKSLPEFDPNARNLAWERALEFLARLSPPQYAPTR